MGVQENIINEKVTFIFAIIVPLLLLLPPFSCNHGEEDTSSWTCVSTRWIWVRRLTLIPIYYEAYFK